jgi:hypothetical protein
LWTLQISRHAGLLLEFTSWPPYLKIDWQQSVINSPRIHFINNLMKAKIRILLLLCLTKYAVSDPCADTNNARFGCKDCYLTGGNGGCNTCQDGYGSLNAYTGCTICPIGTYAKALNTNGGVCTTCPTDKSTLTTGKTVVEDCITIIANCQVPATDTTCTTCKTGYSVSQAKTCTSCLELEGCLECASETSCTKCKANYFAPSATTGKCTACGDGKFSEASNSLTAAVGCSACSVGCKTRVCAQPV